MTQPSAGFQLVTARQFESQRSEVVARLPSQLQADALYGDALLGEESLVDPRQIWYVYASLRYSLDHPFDDRRPQERARLHLIGKTETLTIELRLWKSEKSHIYSTLGQDCRRWYCHFVVNFTLAKLPVLAEELYYPVLELEPRGYKLRIYSPAWGGITMKLPSQRESFFSSPAVWLALGVMLPGMMSSFYWISKFNHQ